jgi:hypothetical protein
MQNITQKPPPPTGDATDDGRRRTPHHKRRRRKPPTRAARAAPPKHPPKKKQPPRHPTPELTCLQSASRPTVASSRRFLPAQARAKKTPAIESTPISPLGFEARQLAGSKTVPERSQSDPSGNLTRRSTSLSNPINNRSYTSFDLLSNTRLPVGGNLSPVFVFPSD